MSRIYTAKQSIYVYHAHFSGERKLYVKTGHIYKMTVTILLIKLGEIVYAQSKIYNENHFFVKRNDLVLANNVNSLIFVYKALFLLPWIDGLK